MDDESRKSTGGAGPSSPQSGQRLSHYRIIEKIGEGGMGVVYRAVDEKLLRPVALKILPPGLVGNEERRRRFLREARAAAAVSHPNIAHVYEIDEADGVVFIAMELAEGQTLRALLGGRQLDIKEAAGLAAQMAQGLAAAHTARVIHRDLKPENIMVTADGHLRILDFGLAKLHEEREGIRRSDLATLTEEMTWEGRLLGTPAYMSPEQARGKPVDARSDIFAFGSTLYEMVTGMVPFSGKTTTDVLSAILRDEPVPASQRNNEVPAELERIIARCHRKEPQDRYQHADELAVDLRLLKRTTDSDAQPFRTPGTPVSVRKTRRRRTALLVALGGLVTALVAGGIMFLGRGTTAREPRIVRTLKLTGAPGLEDFPSLSPDGTRLAYASDESGQLDIWVHQVSAGRKINLTADYDGYDGHPAWSPDGEWIAFVSAREGGGIFVMPGLGGPPRRVVSLPLAPHFDYLVSLPTLSWSPDGHALVYAHGGRLYTLSLARGESNARELPPRVNGIFISEPAWSPDGRHIAYTELTGSGVTKGSIALVSLDGNLIQSITDGHSFDHSPVWWRDGRRLFFVSDRGGGLDIWWVPLGMNGTVEGEPKPLTTGNEVGSIALSADGAKLVYSKVIEYSNIWTLPVAPGRRLTLDDARPVIMENNKIESLSLSTDGAWIAFDSNRKGNADIWRMRTDGSDLRQVTIDPSHDWAPSFSPDGEYLVFHSFRGGNRDLFIVPVAGGTERQLTDDPSDDAGARWSPEGNLIAYGTFRGGGGREIWVVPAAGGEPRQVTFGGGHRPTWSPDGRKIAFRRTASADPRRQSVYLVSPDGGNAEELSKTWMVEFDPLAWSPDGNTIYVYGNDASIGASPNYWALSTTDGSVRQLTDFPTAARHPTWWLAADSTNLYFVLWERKGDLWIADLNS